MLFNWTVQVQRGTTSLILGQVIEQSEARARLAALSKYAVPDCEKSTTEYAIFENDNFTVILDPN